MMKVLGILIKEGNLNVTELEDTLETYYRELGCKYIDVARRHIGGKRFDIVCDDEGLYGDGFISLMNERTQTPMLVGNLFICNHDRNGIFTSLSDDDIQLITKHWKHHVLWSDEPI